MDPFFVGRWHANSVIEWVNWLKYDCAMSFQWLNWSNPVSFWWIFLICVSILNISFWSWTYFYRFRSVPINFIFRRPLSPKTTIWFSAFYVFGCAFRSALPRADVQRMAIFDTWFSSIFIGRTVASIAELSFVVQWSITIAFLAHTTGSSIAAKISRLIVLLIFIAEVFSWYAVIRTHYIGNAVEESLWALTYCLIGLAIWNLKDHLKGMLRTAATITVMGCTVYVAFMILIDVPMYIHRLQQDTLSGKPLLSLWAGFVDLNTHWTVTHNIQEWREEIPWMSLYFSLAVWVSLALCYLPLDREKIKAFVIDKIN